MPGDESQLVEPSLLDEWFQAVQGMEVDALRRLHQVNPKLLWVPLNNDLDVRIELCERLGASLEPLSGLDYAVLKGRETLTAAAALPMARFFIEKSQAHELNNHVWGDCGNTTLHLASFLGQELIIQQLLEKGATTEVKNQHGYFPRDVALTRDILRILSPSFTMTRKESILRPNYSTPDRFKQLRTLAEHSSGLDVRAGETKHNTPNEEEVELERRRTQRQKEVKQLAERAAVKNNPFRKRTTEHKPSSPTTQSSDSDANLNDEAVQEGVRNDKRNSKGITSLKCKSYVSSSVFLVNSEASSQPKAFSNLEPIISSNESSSVDDESACSDIDPSDAQQILDEGLAGMCEEEKDIRDTGILREELLHEPIEKDVTDNIHNAVLSFDINQTHMLTDEVAQPEMLIIEEEEFIRPVILPAVIEEGSAAMAAKKRDTDAAIEPSNERRNVPERKVIRNRQSVTKSRHLSAGLSSWIAALDREFNLAPLNEKEWNVRSDNIDTARVSDDSHGSRGMGGLSYNSSDSSSRSESMSEETIDKWPAPSPLQQEEKFTVGKPQMFSPSGLSGYGSLSAETTSSYVVHLPPSIPKSKAWPKITASASMPSSLAKHALDSAERLADSDEVECAQRTPSLDEFLMTAAKQRPRFNIKRKPVPTSFSSPSLLHGVLDPLSPSKSIFITPSTSFSANGPQLNRRPKFGKLYLRVKGVHDLLVPMPKERTNVRCVVSDGRFEYISRCEVLDQNVIFNYECIIDVNPNTIITVSLHVRSEILIKNSLVRLFTPPRKRKQTLFGYINHEDGAIGQTRFALSDMIHACEGKSYESKFHCFNAWYARTSRERQRQRKQRGQDDDCVLKVVGDFDIEMLYLSVADPTAPLPKSLRECEMAIKVQQWNEIGPKSVNGQGSQFGQKFDQPRVGALV